MTDFTPEKLKEIGAKIDAAFEKSLADKEGIAYFGLAMIDDVDVLEGMVIAAQAQGELDAIAARGQQLHGRVAWLNVYLTLRQQGFNHTIALDATRKTWPDVGR